MSKYDDILKWEYEHASHRPLVNYLVNMKVILCIHKCKYHL